MIANFQCVMKEDTKVYLRKRIVSSKNLCIYIYIYIYILDIYTYMQILCIHMVTWLHENSFPNTVKRKKAYIYKYIYVYYFIYIYILFYIYIYYNHKHFSLSSFHWKS